MRSLTGWSHACGFIYKHKNHEYITAIWLVSEIQFSAGPSPPSARASVSRPEGSRSLTGLRRFQYTVMDNLGPTVNTNCCFSLRAQICAQSHDLLEGYHGHVTGCCVLTAICSFCFPDGMPSASDIFALITDTCVCVHVIQVCRVSCVCICMCQCMHTYVVYVAI